MERRRDPSLEKVRCRTPPLWEDFKMTKVSMVVVSHTWMAGLKVETSPVATIDKVGCFAMEDILTEWP